jgi:hypothetical protein
MPQIVKKEAIDSIIKTEHHDPFQILGMHESEINGKKCVVVRTFLPDSEKVEIVDASNGDTFPTSCLNKSGFFEGIITSRKEVFPYRLKSYYPNGASAEFYDSYAFWPTSLKRLGQLMLPRELFKSSKKLDEDQIFLLRTHPLLGEIELRNAELPFDAVPVMIRWHHEKWDGSGYPDGLKGTEIPLISRIITLADTISAMSSSRPYRNKVFKNDEILRELDCQAALQFDPELVEIYKRINANLNLKGDTK